MKLTCKLFSFLLVMLFLLTACQLTGSATQAGSGGTTAPAGAATTAPFTYVNQENGVTVHYPNGWTTQTPPSGDQGLILFVSPDQSIQSELFVSPLQSADTAQSATVQMAGSALQGLCSNIFVDVLKTMGWNT